MNLKHKMTKEFRHVEGGLFSKVQKADVGDGYMKMAEMGVALLGWADPFFPDPVLPKHVGDALVNAFQHGTPSHYTMPIGNSLLKRKIAQKITKQSGVELDPSRNILVTPGSDSGLFYAMLPFIEPGDEVMIPDPSYPNNFQNTRILGGVPVSVPLRESENYQLNLEEFEKHYTPKTKMVVLTHPNNPTTTVFRRENLEKLCHWIIEKDLILVVDQAFEDHIYDGIEFVIPAFLPKMWERTITVCSVSKGLALSGFRVGYIYCNDHFMDAFYGAAVSVLGATNTAAQIAVITALEDDSFVQEYGEIFNRRRKFLRELVDSSCKVTMVTPESSFLAWINVSKIGKSSEIVDYLVKEAKVAVNNGYAYGPNAGEHVRVVYGCLADDSELFRALERMISALDKFTT